MNSKNMMVLSLYGFLTCLLCLKEEANEHKGESSQPEPKPVAEVCHIVFLCVSLTAEVTLSLCQCH